MDAKGYIKMKDITLADYIKRTTEELKKDLLDSTQAEEKYLVYPEQHGEEDRPVNPYGEH